ncbi:hypothetical protein Vadar_013761 [Vaccinium darrowii]|uniref:Uncharacterized protein n=1 Tax=Vaccinium darrowii TaxID=229202 RepID=A0ACB7YM37_9ERIC|nr:hypothetical protein Vadar_013761 [Vaccinium darrowii]
MEMGMVARWKLRWQTWDLRVVILVSLGLQILLIFVAPLRKRVSRAWITMPIWSAYLLADVMANFAVGLISNSQGMVENGKTMSIQCRHRSGPFADPTLLAFWAPFLLLHLGGPDTITAFSLADNELWLRHLLGLGFQCCAVGYAFIQSYPNHKFWIPTLLMFLVGVIKYSERTRALYLASSRIFQDSLLEDPDPGPNYAKFMDEYTSKNNAKLPTSIQMIPEPSKRNKTGTDEAEEGLSDLEVVQAAHKYYLTFRGLIADLIFSSAQRNESRDFFLKQTARDAFKIVEVELNFFYEILYTKAKVMQRKYLGYPLRVLSFILTCAALVLFYLIEKKKFHKFDIVVSYILLVGAIALDLIASLMILYSDWTAIALTKSDPPNWFIKKLQCLLNVKRKRWPETPKPQWFSHRKIMQIVRLRWSESLSQYNLINYCLHPRMGWWEKTIGFFGLTIMLDGIKYVNTEDFTSHLRDLIFAELKMKSDLANDLQKAKEIFSARGDWILKHEGHINLLDWINKIEFDESLILWHIATELCYYTNHSKDEKTSGNSYDDDTKLNRELSKVLSDYMLYLLIMQSPMLSSIAGIGKMRFRDTCAEAKKFFLGRKILKEDVNFRKIFTSSKCFSCCFSKYFFNEEKGQDKKLQEACESILKVNTEVSPVTVKGDRSKSVLFDACRLAKELQKLKRKQIWKIISKVWVELMSYAAGHCRVNAHMAQLSKGGQLLTLVWLLMAHLGLGDQFQIREGHARAKLIVSK